MSGGFGSFVADLNKFAAQLGPYLDECVQNVGFELFENIVVGGTFAPGTPVDTGFARNSWWVSIGTPGTPRQPELGDGTTVPFTGFAEAQTTIPEVRSGTDLYLLTNTAYMLELEFGHSNKAPAGMIRLTLAQAQALVDKVAHQMGAS